MPEHKIDCLGRLGAIILTVFCVSPRRVELSMIFTGSLNALDPKQVLIINFPIIYPYNC
jgi:hypothetical protein